MDDTKSNPYTLIAGFLLPWKVNKNSTRKATKQQWKAMCVDTACAPMPPKPHAVYHSSRENFRKKSRIQKVKNFSTFRFFSFFRLFEQKSPGMGTFRLFNFSRSKIVIFTVWPLPARRAHSQLGNHQICIVTPEKIDFSNLLYFWVGMYYFLCFGCNRVYGCIHKWGRAPNCQKIVSKPLVFGCPIVSGKRHFNFAWSANNYWHATKSNPW